MDSGSMIKYYLWLEISGPLHLENLVVTGLKLRDIVCADIVLAGLYTSGDKEVMSVMTVCLTGG
ncbi:MAG: hypothetical protein JRN32_02960 [Nitrososphaerota archaeon]|nr:hypothetical protein [Nitrososphaerota archaeon]MDG7039579.1 hypothetical protein [Nitrososphaerota archaeon]MDG7045761.1 hypothetical protein [Nitrososphaerota archaeon]